MADQLTDEELQQLMAVQPRAFDATQLQPVIAPPNTQPNPSMPPIQAPDVQAQGQQPQATPPVAIAPPPTVQAQQRQFAPVSVATQPPVSPSVAISAPKPAPFAAVTLPKPIATPLAVAQPLAPGAPAPVTLPDKDDDPLQAKTERDQAEQERLQKSGSGVSQIFKPVDSEGNPDPNKHPGFWKKLGGVAAKIGDVGLTTLFPSVAAQIPGTELHHQVLMNQQNQRVSIDLNQQKAQQDIDTQDQADEIAAQNATKVPVTNPVTGQTYFIPQKNVAKFLGQVVTTQGRVKTSTDRVNERLAESGLKYDEDGNVVPVDDDQLPPKLKSDIAYKKVREDLMERSKNSRRQRRQRRSPRTIRTALSIGWLCSGSPSLSRMPARPRPGRRLTWATTCRWPTTKGCTERRSRALR